MSVPPSGFLMYTEQQPVARTRGRLRMWFGTTAYTLRRHLEWHLPGHRYAAKRVEYIPSQFPHRVVYHASPLYRQLRNVDLWLQKNKVVNLKLAAQALHGLVLAPGETFSFWKTVGHPTRRKGYQPGMVLVNGGFRPGIGGGLCQMSNLIYWMTLHTPLCVVERYRHQYDVFPDAGRTLPFGSGATVAYNYIDLQIYNPTSQAFVLEVCVTEKELQGAWWSNIPLTHHYEVYERHHIITQNTSGDYIRHNEIWRRECAMDGDRIRDCKVTENHAFMMYSPLLPSGSS